MRLYRMELYKICSRKIFILGVLASLVITILYFWSFVVGTDCTINGVKYTGYQAVRMDREITEEFKGVITDQKVTQIVEKYGFPSGVSEYHTTFLDRNYLNQFVMSEFSDGYFNDSDDYQIATCTYPIAETELGKASAATGKTLMLEYSYGWQVFTEVLGFGCIPGMVLILLSMAPVFSEERYINTQQILFTTREGKTKDVAAKIAAGMTIAIGVYAVVVLLDFILVWGIFGLDGWDCFYNLVRGNTGYIREWNHYNNMSTWNVKDFISLTLFASFLGMTEAAAIALYFSAHCRSPFQSVIISALCLLAPVCFCVFGRSDYNGLLFILGQLFDVLVLGIAVMCFVPDIRYKSGAFAAKALCLILPMSAGVCFRRIFPFYYTLPVIMIMPDVYSDLNLIMLRYPWVLEGTLLFAAMAAVVFVVCSWKKYGYC